MTDKTTITDVLSKIQRELKVGKSHKNDFGKYNYRNCSDILEAVKPLLPQGYAVTLQDDLVLIGNRYYVRATATLFTTEAATKSQAYAREEEVKKGMDGSQITGAASSYARKYALNGLFAIDDTADADSMNNSEPAPPPMITPDQVNHICTLIEQTQTDMETFCKAMKVKVLGDMDSVAYNRAVELLNRKAEIAAKEKSNAAG